MTKDEVLFIVALICGIVLIVGIIVLGIVEVLKEKFVIDAWDNGYVTDYNKAKKEIQEQDYSLFDFVMKYEDGKFKCKYKSGKEFESIDGETWKEIVTPKEGE